MSPLLPRLGQEGLAQSPSGIDLTCTPEVYGPDEAVPARRIGPHRDRLTVTGRADVLYLWTGVLAGAGDRSSSGTETPVRPAQRLAEKSLQVPGTPLSSWSPRS